MKLGFAVLVALLLALPLVAATSRSVSISGFAFAPTPLFAEPGDVVTWTNEDSTTHTVTCDGPSCGFASPNLGPGATFATTLASAGTTTYHCNFHSTMHGAIYVGTGSPADADLAPDASTFSSARPPLVGPVPDPRIAIVSVVVRNIGASMSPAVQVQFRTTDATGADVELGSPTLQALAPGASATVSVGFNNAPLLGDAPVRVIVDTMNAVVEGQESNNLASGTVHTGLV
jgi:plastocyanin